MIIPLSFNDRYNRCIFDFLIVTAYFCTLASDRFLSVSFFLLHLRPRKSHYLAPSIFLSFKVIFLKSCGEKEDFYSHAETVYSGESERDGNYYQ
jgi:capsule polysaccharide export protein KpsE/RkpR